ncbi:MAG: M28 family peptidase [Armatimonadetes bacterium]|nr:M28 family peptidase [Armatimonadota bacterium]
MPGQDDTDRLPELHNYAYKVMCTVSGFGATELGFRPAGSRAALDTATYLRDEMRRIGLEEVRIEQFPVVGWDFRGASLDVHSPEPWSAIASTYGGVVGTPPVGIRAEVVRAGSGRLQDFSRVDPSGKIVLLDWTFGDGAWVSFPVTEAASRGAVAAIVYSSANFAQAPGALNCHNSKLGESIPVVNVSKTDGERMAEILARGPMEATVRLNAALLPGATGNNVVGVVRGTTWPDQYVLVGSHLDAWFHGFIDNASGTGVLMAIAKSMVNSDERPRRTVVFVAHDAEEFGAVGTDFDFCLGSHWLITREHPDWAGKIAAYVNLDQVCCPNDRDFVVASTPDLSEFVEEACARIGPLAGYPGGFSFGVPPSVWTDAWPYATAGVSAIQNGWSESDFTEQIYHTQYDNADNFGRDKLPATVEVFRRLTLELASRPLLPYAFSSPLRDLAASLANLVPKPWAGFTTEGTENTEGIRVEKTLSFSVSSVPSVVSEEDAGNVQPHPEEEEAITRTRDLIERAVGEAERVERRLKEAEGLVAGADVQSRVSTLLMQAAGALNRNLLTLGGERGKSPTLHHEHYANDARALARALAALEAGDRMAAAAALEGVFSPKFGRNYSCTTYQSEFLQRLDPDRKDLNWGTDRLAACTDVYGEYTALASSDGDASWVLDSLERKHAAALKNFRSALLRVEGMARDLLGAFTQMDVFIGQAGIRSDR